MPQVNIEGLMRRASARRLAEGALPLDGEQFPVRKIVGHRTGPRQTEEYKIEWEDSEFSEIRLHTGTIDNVPIIQDIANAFWSPITRIYTVGWKQTWIPAEFTWDCGELLHDFWTQLFQGSTSNARSAETEDMLSASGK